MISISRRKSYSCCRIPRPPAKWKSFRGPRRPAPRKNHFAAPAGRPREKMISPPRLAGPAKNESFRGLALHYIPESSRDCGPFRSLPGHSWSLPGVSQESPRVLWECPGLSRSLPGVSRGSPGGVPESPGGLRKGESFFNFFNFFNFFKY